MKKKTTVRFILFLAVLMALISGRDVTLGKAADSNITPILAPASVYIHTHANGDHYFKWWIRMPLTDLHRWSISNRVATKFRGDLYVEVDHSNNNVTAPVNCNVIGTITLPSANGPITFGTGYLNCQIPSIKDIAGSTGIPGIIAPGLGYPYEIHNYEDSRTPITGSSNANFMVKVQTQGSGTIFDHPSMKLTKLPSGEYIAEIYDDRGHNPVMNQIQYDTTFHSSGMILSTTALSTITLELLPGHIRWRGLTPPTGINYYGRPGRNFVWRMNAVTTFNIGHNFTGLLGDLFIDPRTSQSTGN